MISFAQNCEDVILRRVFGERKEGFYIDVGAMDPTEDSVTKFFYDQGWCGINIEPNEWFYEKLSRERPRDINLNIAIGEHEETRKLHVYEQYGISTFEDRYRDRFAEKGFEAKESTVRVTTLAAVCREHVHREIDFLKIDCEGWEKFVLMGADWNQYQPVVVVVEATEPLSTIPVWAEWEPLLVSDGRYEMVYFDGLNRFYLRKDHLESRRHFTVPVNVLDEFTPYPLERARQRGAELEYERNTLAVRVTQLEQERDALAGRVTDLGQEVLRTKLWVGQLSQDLAAIKSAGALLSR